VEEGVVEAAVVAEVVAGIGEEAEAVIGLAEETVPLAEEAVTYQVSASQPLGLASVEPLVSRLVSQVLAEHGQVRVLAGRGRELHPGLELLVLQSPVTHSVQHSHGVALQLTIIHTGISTIQRMVMIPILAHLTSVKHFLTKKVTRVSTMTTSNSVRPLAKRCEEVFGLRAGLSVTW